MAKSRKITLAAFNIVTHPHSEQEYEKLFYSAKGLMQTIKVWGDTHALLCSAYRMEELVEPTITGEIFTFLEIDTQQDWFDILKGEVATEKQTKEVVIPQNLRPHLKRIRYVFFPKAHMLVYTRDDMNGSISPSRMEYFLTHLLNDNRILEGAPYQEVGVRLVQDRQSLEWIFQHLRVERLDITIKRPNGDTAGDAEQSVEEELEDQNIEEYFVSQKAENGKVLKPNKRTQRMMQEATINGHVEAKGLDKDDLPRSINTTERPLVEPVYYDSESPYLDFVVRAASDLLQKILRK